MDKLWWHQLYFEYALAACNTDSVFLVFPKRLNCEGLWEKPGSSFTYVSPLNHSSPKHERRDLRQTPGWAWPVPSHGWKARRWSAQENTCLLAHVWADSTSLSGGKGMWTWWAKALWAPFPALSWHATYIGGKNSVWQLGRIFELSRMRDIEPAQEKKGRWKKWIKVYLINENSHCRLISSGSTHFTAVVHLLIMETFLRLFKNCLGNALKISRPK